MIIEEDNHLLSDADSDADIFNARTPAKSKSNDYFKSSYKRVFIISVLVFLCAGTIVVFTVYFRHRYNISKHKSSMKDPVIQTECGPVMGTVETMGKKESFIFKGIPYAIPPLRDLRWSAPVRLNKSTCWKNVFHAKKFASKCSQGHTGSEDCLYLNVMTPTLSNTSNLPVFVWIHGGYLMSGFGNDYGYYPDTEFVTSMNIVGVSMNYRLNAFGFLTLEELWKKDRSYGNYGLMDQILALKWVKDNIKNFGGNPDSVTIAGQSSGGTSIFGLLASPMADGLFHKAIPMSGSPMQPASYKVASKDNVLFINNSRCFGLERNSEKLRECLYSLNPTEVDMSIPQYKYPYWDMSDLLDFPTKGRLDGSLLVIDPIVVTVPPKLLSKFPFKFKGTVSVLIGNMEQENGIQPVQRFTEPNARKKFNAFMKKRLDPFSPTYHDLVMKLYSNLSATRDVQNLYETITTDVRCTCPTNVLAKDFAKSPRHNIYRYIVSYAPVKPVEYTGMLEYPLHNAFHMLDSNALFGYKLPSKFGNKLTESDYIFMKSIRDIFSRFINSGDLDAFNWKPGQTGVFGCGGKIQVLKRDFHETICEFWNEEKNEFVPYQWIN